MRPGESTTGVNARFTPNGLNVTLIWPLSPATGTGNSPPARKFAVSPETAVKVGSARVLSMLVSSSACSVACTVSPPLVVYFEPTSPGVLAELKGKVSGLPPAPFATVPRALVKFVPMPNGPLLAMPSINTPFMLMPSCLMTERCTSTTETLRATCSSPVMLRRLMMPGPEPAE